MLGDLEGRTGAESTQRPQHHPWAATLRLLSKEPAGKGINSPSFSTCLIPGRVGLYRAGLWEAECSAEGCATAPAVARFSPHPLGMSPLLECPCSRMSLAPLGTAVSLRDFGKQPAPYVTKSLAPTKILKDKSSNL